MPARERPQPGEPKWLRIVLVLVFVLVLLLVLLLVPVPVSWMRKPRSVMSSATAGPVASDTRREGGEGGEGGVTQKGDTETAAETRVLNWFSFTS